ncbi:Ap4A hydrolase [Plasmodium sp. gorilla clade G3]|nr:Ap4A hydrolase [Plasmodium sp. gorilla clade G3]
MKINIIKSFGILLCRLKKYNPVITEDIDKFEFLFLKASYADRHWTPPKGLHEHNESGLETAMRETFEETGINKDKYKLLNYQKTLKYNVKDKPKETTYYLAMLLNNEENVILSDEHADYKWIGSHESDTYNLPESLADLLKEAEEFLIKEQL